MNVQAQLALAAGDVSFTFRDEALSVDGNWDCIPGGEACKGRQIGGGG